MVVVSELTSIFWGVALESSKKYSQTTERPVRISMAALDPFQSHDEKPVSLMIERDGNSYVLCTLQHGKQFQQMLDLEFASGEELTFFIRGKGVIHLSGYVMPEDEFPGSIDDLSDSDADKEDEEVAFEEAKPQLYGQNKKRQKSDEETKRLSKKAKMTVEDVDDDDDSDVEKSDETKKLSKKTKMTIEDIDDDDDDDDTDAEFIEDEAEEESDDESDDIDDDESDLEKELLNEDSDDELNDDHEEMEAQYQKKAVTVDRKPVVGKKGDKNVADVKPKQAVQSSVEKTALTKPAVQPSSAATSDTSQVSEGKKKRKRNKKKKNKNVSNQQQQTNGLRG